LYSHSVAVFIILGTYALAIVSVHCNRQMVDFTIEQLIVVAFGMIAVNCSISITSNIRAKMSCRFLFTCASAETNRAGQARRLQPLLWTLIAQTSDSREPRLGHLRLLWLKQARILDSEGGIAMGAFGLRVTYVNVIQVSNTP